MERYIFGHNGIYVSLIEVYAIQTGRKQMRLTHVDWQWYSTIVLIFDESARSFGEPATKQHGTNNNNTQTIAILYHCEIEKNSQRTLQQHQTQNAIITSIQDTHKISVGLFSHQLSARWTSNYGIRGTFGSFPNPPLGKPPFKTRPIEHSNSNSNWNSNSPTLRTT